MSDNEALNDLVDTNREISTNTYNLVEQFNQQLSLYDTPMLAYLASGDIYTQEILKKQDTIINGEIVIAMAIVMFTLYNFVVRSLK